MQNGHYPNATTDVMGIGRQRDDRISGGSDKQTVDVFLMPAHKGQQLMR
jgi:hypothetical protein